MNIQRYKIKEDLLIGEEGNYYLVRNQFEFGA